MKIGYLHIGPPEHGVARYGRYLAREARSRPELEVIESEVILTGDCLADQQRLQAAADELNRADIVHFQYNAELWRGRNERLGNLDCFLGSCRSTLAVTLHDVFLPRHSSVLWAELARGQLAVSGVGALFRALAREHRSVGLCELRKLLKRAWLAFVCTQEEAARLSGYAPEAKLKTIPHFVETRTLGTSAEDARRELGLQGSVVITLLGFIYRGKGYDLVVKALADLPSNYQAVFAGGTIKPEHADHLESIMTLARDLGVAERVRVTGYLSDEEQALYIAATDLAVCPFMRASASGSLSTWISADKRILASDLPQIAEYNRLQPGAILTFSPYTPEALTQAIRTAVQAAPSTQPVAELRRQLQLPMVFDRHMQCYSAALGKL